MCNAMMSNSSSRPLKLMERRSAEPFLMSDDGSSSSLSSASSKKGVRFASVRVREYAITLGDHPSCTGAPIQLSWEHDEYDASISLDEYETERRSTRRRSREELRVPACLRAEWLLEAGFSAAEIHRVIQDAHKDKIRRRNSLEKSTLQGKADVVAESMRRKIERAIGKRGKSNDLYKLWSSLSQ